GASQGAGPAGAAPGARTGGKAAAADVFGVPVKTAGCPAAALRAAAARCPATPECFNGLTIISGSAIARPLPCRGPHVWETFAIAILPADVRTFDQPMVAANPAVRRVCSQAVMLASRQGAARRLPAQDWDIEVLPRPRRRSAAARTSTAASPTRSGASRAPRSSAGRAVRPSQLEAGADRVRDVGGGEPGRHGVLG